MLNLNRKNKYLLACSYGPDSMALLGMLIEGGYDFAVANVNYNLREESTKESEDLKKYCEINGIKLFQLDFAGVFKGNVEKQCREIRYNFFKKTIKENKYDALLVGHHIDDLLETYFLQEQRKNIPTCYGLAKETEIFGVKVIRPLLSLDKKSLINYCHSKKIPFCIDSSNLEDKYQRNIIRHNIVEKMNDLEKLDVLKKINNLNNELKNLREELSEMIINKNNLSVVNDYEVQIALVEKAKKIGCDTDISLKKVQELRKVLKSKKANVELKLSKNMMLEYSYEDIYVYKFQRTNFKVKMKTPSKIDHRLFFADFREDFENRNITLDDFPLTIRNAKLEDVVKVNDYEVKARRLFIDWKMPLHFRRKWPAIVNKDNKVIYIPRYQKNFRKTSRVNFYVK